MFPRHSNAKAICIANRRIEHVRFLKPNSLHIHCRFVHLRIVDIQQPVQCQIDGGYHLYQLRTLARRSLEYFVQEVKNVVDVDHFLQSIISFLLVEHADDVSQRGQID